MKNNQPGMTLIAKNITRLTVGLILIYGIYIVLEGHIGPGGGFAGGVIIALSFIHLMLAFGKDAALKKLNPERGLVLASLGALVFLSVLSLGFFKVGAQRSVEAGFALFGAGLVPVCDISAAIMVGAGLFVIFSSLALLAGKRENK